MKIGTYIDIFCEDCDTTEAVKKTIAATYHPEGMAVRGNELLISIPENHGMGFSMNQLRSLVSPCRVEMFDLEEDADGEPVRWWY